MEQDEFGNVKLRDGFHVVMVWPGTLMGDTTPLEFEEDIELLFVDFKIKVQFLETIQTLPSKDSMGMEIPESGNRSDVFFAVNVPDEGHGFFINRFRYGMRLLGDAISEVNNPNGIIYPERVTKYPH